MPVIDLFPAELRHLVPPLKSQEGTRDPIVYVRFFMPDSGWVWYVTEGSAEDDDFVFFGFVVGVEEEWGEFSLSELSGGPSDQAITRDPNFRPARLSEILAKDLR